MSSSVYIQSPESSLNLRVSKLARHSHGGIQHARHVPEKFGIIVERPGIQAVESPNVPDTELLEIVFAYPNCSPHKIGCAQTLAALKPPQYFTNHHRLRIVIDNPVKAGHFREVEFLLRFLDCLQFRRSLVQFAVQSLRTKGGRII